jgi:hypothetical protein
MKMSHCSQAVEESYAAGMHLIDDWSVPDDEIRAEISRAANGDPRPSGKHARKF